MTIILLFSSEAAKIYDVSDPTILLTLESNGSTP
jgi:hypothetical protein